MLLQTAFTRVCHELSSEKDKGDYMARLAKQWNCVPDASLSDGRSKSIVSLSRGSKRQSQAALRWCGRISLHLGALLSLAHRHSIFWVIFRANTVALNRDWQACKLDELELKTSGAIPRLAPVFGRLV